MTEWQLMCTGALVWSCIIRDRKRETIQRALLGGQWEALLAPVPSAVPFIPSTWEAMEAGALRVSIAIALPSDKLYGEAAAPAGAGSLAYATDLSALAQSYTESSIKGEIQFESVIVALVFEVNEGCL